MMLCQSCTEQQACLPWKLAHHDRHLQGLLRELEACERHQAAPRSTLWRQYIGFPWLMGIALAAIAVGTIVMVQCNLPTT